VLSSFILDNEALVRWFLAHGADPNTESRNGLTPFLRAVGWAPLSTVSLLHQAGGSTALAVPFVCSPWPPRASTNSGNSQAPAEPESESTERLAVLRYVLDAGADPDARKWAHNRRGYAGDFDWGSGLNAALVNGAHDLANELLRRGARTDIPTFNIASRGETALELSGRYAPHLLPITKELRMKQESS
jgi:ankyrin repeat protein